MSLIEQQGGHSIRRTPSPGKMEELHLPEGPSEISGEHMFDDHVELGLSSTGSTSFGREKHRIGSSWSSRRMATKKFEGKLIRTAGAPAPRNGINAAAPSLDRAHDINATNDTHRKIDLP